MRSWPPPWPAISPNVRVPMQLCEARAYSYSMLPAPNCRRHWSSVISPSSVTACCKEKEMLIGLRTVIYPAPELAKAKQWYSEVLGAPPYFDEPFYVGFSVG